MGLAVVSSSVADEFRHSTASATICAGLAVLGVPRSTTPAADILSRLRSTGYNLVPGPLSIGRIGHIACSTPETGPRTAYGRFSRKVRVENKMLGEKFRQLSAASLLGLCATSFDVRSQDGRPWVDPPTDPTQTAVDLSQPSGSAQQATPGDQTQSDNQRDRPGALGSVPLPGVEPKVSVPEKSETGSASLNEPDQVRQSSIRTPEDQKVKPPSRSTRTVRRGTSRNAARTGGAPAPFVKLFGPPRRNAHIITNNSATH
jgi:hypothetical protein